VARRATRLLRVERTGARRLWLCIAGVWPTAKHKAALSPLKNENIHRGVRDLEAIIIGLLFMPREYCWLPVGGNE
jgi:hypothetical protein